MVKENKKTTAQSSVNTSLLLRAHSHQIKLTVNIRSEFDFEKYGNPGSQQSIDMLSGGLFDFVAPLELSKFEIGIKFIRYICIPIQE